MKVSYGAFLRVCALPQGRRQLLESAARGHAWRKPFARLRAPSVRPARHGEVDALPPQYKIVHGHFKALRYSKIKNRFLFTILRNPIDNLISIYFFCRTFPPSDNDWHLKFLEEKPSILDFARYAPFRRHMSQAYFGGFDMKSFDFIGFHETRQEDYLKLGSLINLPLSGEVHANKTDTGHEERIAITESRQIIGELTDLLADDLNFYNQLYLERRG